MSTVLNNEYFKILKYWNNKLFQNKNRYKFLALKVLEISSFYFFSNKKHIYIPSNSLPPTKSMTPVSNPKICVVIPIFISHERNKEQLVNLFNSLLKQTKKPDLLIIVNDASPISFEYPRYAIYRTMELNSGPAKARNLGIETALSNNVDIIAFTDSDCIPSKTWIETIYNSFTEDLNTHQILAGNTVSNDNNFWGEYHNINDSLNGRRFPQSDCLLYGTTANLAVHQTVFRNIKFNEKFPDAAAEDIEFCLRAIEAGYSIGYSAGMIVKHHYGYTNNNLDNSLKFIKKHKKYGCGEKILLEEFPNYYSYFYNTKEIPCCNVLNTK